MVHPEVVSVGFPREATACGLKICERKGKTAKTTTIAISPRTTTMSTRGISVPVGACVAIRVKSGESLFKVVLASEGLVSVLSLTSQVITLWRVIENLLTGKEISESHDRVWAISGLLPFNCRWWTC